jgi:hypothetical protein
LRDQQFAAKRPWRLARFPLASVVAAAAMVAAASAGSAASTSASVGSGGSTAVPSSWTVASSPSQLSLPNGVSCTSSTFCVAVGLVGIHDSEYTQPQIVTWNGTTWSLTPAPKKSVDSALASVSCISASDCVAVGEYDGGAGGPGYRTLSEVWNGTAWSIVPSPNKTTEDNGLDGVSCTSASNCVAVGYYSYAHDTPLALIESWNGSAWSIVPAPARSNDSWLNGVSCTSSSSCVAVGAYETSSEYRKTLVESWNGSDWSVVPSPNAGTSSEFGIGLGSVSCVDASHCVAVGGYYVQQSASEDEWVSLIESWNGAKWSLMPSPNPPGGVLWGGVSCILATECVAVGGYDSSQTSVIETLNGSVWSVTPNPSDAAEVLFGVSCVKSGTCVAVGDGIETGPA